MLLCTDVGNTNIKFALYDGSTLKMKLTFSTTHHKTADDYAVELYAIFQLNNISTDEIDGSIISSVVPVVTTPLKKAVKKVTGIDSMIVEPGLKTGLDIRVDLPATVGADLVCTCVAVKELYPCPAIVVGLGTATTILYINEQKAYCGGSILPGIQISLDALTQRAALLTSVNLSEPKKVIGTNTTDLIQNGIIYGNASMIDGMIDHYENEIGQKCTHIATGGFAPLITKYCKKNLVVNDNLVLEGLRLIYNRNCE